MASPTTRYHLPAIAYSAVLKFLAIRRGVVAHQAQAVNAVLHVDGSIASIELDGARRVTGDFFLDVTGEEGQLMSALAVQRESWRDYFVPDCALIGYGAPIQPIPVYSEVRTWTEGWVALHPTQMCTHIYAAYSSAFLSDEAALLAATRISGMALQGAERCEPGNQADAPSRGSETAWPLVRPHAFSIRSTAWTCRPFRSASCTCCTCSRCGPITRSSASNITRTFAPHSSAFATFNPRTIFSTDSEAHRSGHAHASSSWRRNSGTSSIRSAHAASSLGTRTRRSRSMIGRRC